MTYPMNELVNDLEKSAKTADHWISGAADAIGEACHHATDDVTSALERGRDFSKATAKSARRKVRAADELMHSNPYPSILIAAAAGALAGIILTWRLTNRCAGRS